jgi:hypothetical protein
MANFSDLTRKEQVLAALKSRPGEWFDTAALSNETVGGSEGIKRLRELKRDGWLIQMRKSPVQGSDQFQYRLAVQLRTDGTLAYYDPTLHPEDHVNKERIQNGGPQPRSEPAPTRSDPAPQPAQSTWMDPKQQGETSIRDWAPAKKAPGTLEHVFWIEQHQRAIGAIGALGDGRWGWGVLIPANKAKMTRMIRAGHGVVSDRQEAIDAVEHTIRRLREERGTSDYFDKNNSRRRRR